MSSQSTTRGRKKSIALTAKVNFVENTLEGGEQIKRREVRT